MANPKLSGKVAIVTGGGGGIGRAICKKLALEGANIGIVDVDKSGMETTLALLSCSDGNSHCVVEGDISRHEDVLRAFQAVEDRFGMKCSILINNAGVDGKAALVGDLEEKEIDRVLDINLRGTILMSNEFVKRLKTAEDQSGQDEVRGCVVNISSTAAKLGAVQGAVYSASKSGIIGLTKSMALEFPFSKIRCNAILPGAVDTQMFARVRQTLPSMDIILATIPMQRIGQPDEIADTCLYLVSDQSSYVNGLSLEVSGGLGC